MKKVWSLLYYTLLKHLFTYTSIYYLLHVFNILIIFTKSLFLPMGSRECSGRLFGKRVDLKVLMGGGRWEVHGTL